MQFIIEKKILYQSLQKIIRIIVARPKSPILSHLLLKIIDNFLYITATNLEIEITSKILLNDVYVSGSGTVSGRKFMEICRAYSENSKIFVQLKDNKFYIHSERCNFCLLSYPVSDFPQSNQWTSLAKFSISQNVLKKMLELTLFSMGNDDIRFYLNGVFFLIKKRVIEIVATDGNRLAMCSSIINESLIDYSAIVPRKGISEISRLLSVEEKPVLFEINMSSIRMEIKNYVFISKLIDSTFPKYRDILAQVSKNILEVVCSTLKCALRRVAILSNEKFRAVQFFLTMNELKITAHNFEDEVSEEILEVVYTGKNMKISFNADYILDVLNVIDDQKVIRFLLKDDMSGMKIESVDSLYKETYIIMPICI